MSQRNKVILAVVFFALAGVAIAWQMGVFESAPKGVQQTDAPEIVERDQGAEGLTEGVVGDGRNVRGIRPGGVTVPD